MQKIAIHSVPRSGSTWLGNIFNSHEKVNFSYQPLFSYAFRDYLDENSTKERIDSFFEQISKSDDEFIRQESGIKKGIIPRFHKENSFSHVCYKEVRFHHILENILRKDAEIKIIGLVRSPFATIYSWLNAPKEFRPDLGWKVKEEWKNAPSKNLHKKEEFNGYNKWKEAAFLFEKLEKEFPERFLVINYDDLLEDTIVEVEKMFDFVGLELSKQTLDFLQKSKSVEKEDAYSVFKSKKNDLDWQGKLPQFIVDKIKNDPDFVRLNERFSWI